MCLGPCIISTVGETRRGVFGSSESVVSKSKRLKAETHQRVGGV